jgi:putative transposase
MCRVLEVSVSGYYAWRKRPPCARKREDGELTRRIVQAFTTHRNVYGSPRIQVELRTQGMRCGRNRIARLMREAHLCARPRAARGRATHRDPTATARIAPSAPQSRVHCPGGQSQVGRRRDVHSHPPGMALRRTLVLDLFSRLVVGWAMAETDDEHLVEQALRMALGRREPQANLLHHSDQGSEYTSHAYLARLASRGIQLSMSRTGNCYDNAVMERFFGTLKRECPMDFATRQQARSAIFDYIESFYNRVRRHSTLGYLSPIDFELSKR